MNNRLAATLILALIGTPLSAHRLDEYLQATIVSVEKKRVHAEMRLTPGVAVLPEVLANIDANADGVISKAEQWAYAEQVVHDLSFTIDGDRLTLHLGAIRFPAMEEITEGRGEIQLEVDADLPRNGPNHRLIFENQHERRIGAYLVNCLVPRDPDIHIVAQNRNYSQSFYQLDFVDASVRSIPLSLVWLSGAGKPMGTVAFLLLVWLALLWRNRARLLPVGQRPEDGREFLSTEHP